MGTLRVIAGRHRGRRLTVPSGRHTRPTADRVREALFSMLAANVQDAVVLDLFAGSGALAIEALSRGADTAELVDDSPAAIAAILQNLEALELSAHAVVAHRDALAYLLSARTAGRQYDLVFVDPPYQRAATLRDRLSSALGPVLGPEARVVVESDRRAPLSLTLPLLSERTYGDTMIQIHGPETHGTR